MLVMFFIMGVKRKGGGFFHRHKWLMRCLKAELEEL